MFRVNSMIALFLLLCQAVYAGQDSNPAIALSGDWTVQVICNGKETLLTIDPPDIQTYENERYAKLVVYNGPAWRPAEPITGVDTAGCSVENNVIDDQVTLRLEPGAEPLENQKDFIFDPVTGNLGRTETGRIGPETPVYLTYKSLTQRIDSVVQDADGTFITVRGKPSVATPVPPELTTGQTCYANIWVHGKIDKLTDQNIFPIQKPGQDPYDFNLKSPEGTLPVAAKLLPKTWAKLQKGEEVHILAWGDSVTVADYVSEDERWQNQFIVRLKALFPQAKIVLESEAWGGRTTDTYINEPEGSPKNYREKVLNRHPDLIISEFVNDAWMDEATVAERYGRLLRDFQENDMEWIICTPHYIRPSWMNLDRVRNIADDPRPYVKGLRAFAAENKIALADAALLYGQLDLRGIPYLTLMTNNINHPNGKGLSLFASALMNLFQ